MPARLKNRSFLRTTILLLGISAIALFVPGHLTSALSNLMQLFVPVQHLFFATTHSSRAAAGDDSTPRSPADEHQIVALSLRVQELELAVEELARLRNRGLNNGRLIPARVVAADALAWRESRLINSGTLRGIQKGNAVMSDYFINTGNQDSVTSGMTVLSGETLVGEIVQVYTHTARVLLLSDPQSKEHTVRIARLTPDGVRVVPSLFYTRGRGGGLLEVRGVDRKFIENGDIQTSDFVLTTGQEDALPASVTIGRVTEIHRDDENGVFYRLTVQPDVDLNHLQRVYVVDCSR